MAPGAISPTILASNGAIFPFDSSASLTKTSHSSPSYRGYHHMTWYVGNAKQAASYYVTRMGFREIAFRGLETGSRHIASRVVSNGAAIFILTSPIRPVEDLEPETSTEDRILVEEIHEHLRRHGDAVKDVAFEVDDVVAVYSKAVERGAFGVQKPTIFRDPECGEVMTAVVKTYGETTHTLIDCSRYSGSFLPGYRPITTVDPLEHLLPPVPLEIIDHCVGNQDWNRMEAVCEYYEKCLDFHRFWTIDDKNLTTDYSTMNSIVMASADEIIKMPINEPALGKKRSQIEEFVDFYSGAGVQHVAFLTHDILTAVTNLKARGVEFMSVPDEYYAVIAARLKSLSNKSFELREDFFRATRQLNILIDFDEGGYLLQIFTKPVLDRPTVFMEIIQRHGFDGFGAGNFRALFEAVEREQAKRGNL
ncbi:hypothetical protein MMC25_002738 [Agyrium rufum]|nr:hypothetical protein [Agyrium rufum]